MMFVKSLLLISLVVSIHARKLPPGITPCSQNDPNINDCALRNGRLAIKHIIDGVPSYQIPSFDPLHISEIDIAAPNQPRQVSLALIMKDVDVHGLREAKLENISIDLSRDYLWWDCKVPQVSLLGRYNISGRVLVLPIRGHGDMNVTLENVTFKFKFGIQRYMKKNGREYITPKDNSLVFDTTRAHLKLENLFDGEQALSDQMNVFLNENWREMIEELGPPVAEALSAAVTQIVSGISRVVPFNEMFPENSVPTES